MLSSCVGSTSINNSGSSTIVDPKEPVASVPCLASQPKDVNMWINAMPGPGTSSRSPLRASFTVTTPTPGYQFSLKVNRVMESFPQVNIMLENFPGSVGSSVQVNCGGKPFFKINKLMAVH